MKPLFHSVLFGLLLFTMVGCQRTRNLKVTEIGTNRVELFLDESSNNTLNLTSISFTWTSQEPGAASPVRGDVSLDPVGALNGQQYLVIFEDANYHGPPMAENFRPNTPGIKVRDGFFPGYGNDPGVAMNVNGSHTGTAVLFVPTTESINDLVRFGPSPRPTLPGTFSEDGSLNSVKPQGGQSISRRFSGGTPVETDSAHDWSLQPESIGLANP
jgi:hypothetical protein